MGVVFFSFRKGILCVQRMGIRSMIEGGRECNKFVPVLGGNGTKRFPTGDIFDQPSGKLVEFGASLPTMWG